MQGQKDCSRVKFILISSFHLLHVPSCPHPVEKQQTSLTEWCKVREGVPRQETQRDKVATRILQENDLLDDGGDGVFSQLVNT